jgi:hypothetical protein
VFAAVLFGLPESGIADRRFEPVIVVEDATEIGRELGGLGVPFDRTFVASLNDARRARRDLGRFVRAEMKRSNPARTQRLRQILLTEPAYVWHCGGFERLGSRFLHCSFVRYSQGHDHLRTAHFPEIADGGTDVARCNFSLKADQIVTLQWNSPD